MIMSDVSFFYKITRENETLQNVILRLFTEKKIQGMRTVFLLELKL